MDTPLKFIETICFKDGAYQLITYHQDRVNRTYKEFFPGTTPLNLAEVLPTIDFEERYKVRVIYSTDYLTIEYEVYTPKAINTLKLVRCNAIDYAFKFHDRTALMDLLRQRQACDDIIISINNQVTDCSYANLVFFDGQDWYTPNTFLLSGVKRQYLIDTNQLQQTNIGESDISNFKLVGFINAMLDLGELTIPTTNILL